MQEETQSEAFTLNQQALQKLEKHFKYQFSQEKLRKKCLNFSIHYEWD